MTTEYFTTYVLLEVKNESWLYWGRHWSLDSKCLCSAAKKKKQKNCNCKFFGGKFENLTNSEQDFFFKRMSYFLFKIPCRNVSIHIKILCQKINKLNKNSHQLILPPEKKNPQSVKMQSFLLPWKVCSECVCTAVKAMLAGSHIKHIFKWAKSESQNDLMVSRTHFWVKGDIKEADLNTVDFGNSYW